MAMDSDLRWENRDGENVFWDYADILEELTGVGVDDKGVRRDRPQFVAHALYDLLEKIQVTDQHDKIDIIGELLRAEKQLLDELGREEYNKKRGIIIPDNPIEEYLESGVLPDRRTYESALIENAQIFVKEREFKKRLHASDEQFDQTMLALRQSKERDIPRIQQLIDQAKGLVSKIRESFGTHANILERARAEVEAKQARKEAFVIKLAPRLKKARQAIASRSAESRFENYLKSEQGQETLSNFIHLAARVSLASRRAMGMRTHSTPSKSDLKIARKMAEALIESGSLAQRNIIKHAWRARLEAADWVGKNSKSKTVSDKAPSFAKVRSQLKDMSMSFDEMADHVKSDKALENTVSDKVEARKSSKRERLRAAKQRADEKKTKAKAPTLEKGALKRKVEKKLKEKKGKEKNPEGPGSGNDYDI